jgi:hypothetical protein
MNLKHKIKFIAWSIIVAVAMCNDRLRCEYNDYREATWKRGNAAFDSKEWLHRRWFPKKYQYEWPSGPADKRPFGPPRL